MRYDFPGNIRELENIIEYSFILCSSGFIQLEHLPEKFHPHTAASPNTTAPMTMEEVKVHAAHEALARNQGKKMAACRELDISKDTLRRLLRHNSA